jgi:hypothetical protein
VAVVVRASQAPRLPRLGAPDASTPAHADTARTVMSDIRPPSHGHLREATHRTAHCALRTAHCALRTADMLTILPGRAQRLDVDQPVQVGHRAFRGGPEHAPVQSFQRRWPDACPCPPAPLRRPRWRTKFLRTRLVPHPVAGPSSWALTERDHHHGMRETPARSPRRKVCGVDAPTRPERGAGAADRGHRTHGDPDVAPTSRPSDLLPSRQPDSPAHTAAPSCRCRTTTSPIYPRSASHSRSL